MSFNARFSLLSPETAEAQMTISMTLKEWEELRDQLVRTWPSSRLSNAITDLLAQARKIFWAQTDVS